MKKILSRFAMVMLLLCLITTSVTANGERRSPKDIKDLVTQGPVVIYAKAPDGTWTSGITDENGNLINPSSPPTLEVGQGLSFKVKWSIDDVLNKQLVDGDWFDFNLPSNYFEFESTLPASVRAFNESTNQFEVIGTFQILASSGGEPAKIRVVLNSEGVKKAHISNGSMSVVGIAKSIKDKDEQTEIGDFTLAPIVIVPKDPTVEIADYEPIHKYGWQIPGKDLVSWELLVNFGDLKKVYNGEISNLVTKNNVILVDELPEGMSFADSSKIDIAMPIYASTETGKMSNIIVEGGWNNISMNNLTEILQNTGETWSDFKNRIESAPAKSYGKFIDPTDNRTKLIFNFGNLPGSLNSKNSLSEIYSIIDADSSLTANQKHLTKEAYARIFANSNNTGVIGFQMQLQGLEVSGGTKEYVNEASLKWNTSDGSVTESIIKFQVSGGSAETGDPQSVTIKKFESDTTNALKGAKFKLQVQKNGNLFVDYVPAEGDSERETDELGTIVFSNLPNGKYRVVETQAPIGYSDDVSFLNGVDTFEINGTESGTIFITAYNPKLISVSGTKTWSDGNNVDGIRPSSITVNLYGNGTLIESKSVSESDNWSYQFDNLPKNESGVAIVYTITEDAVPGYETTITGYDITNTHIPETVSVSGTKTWSDGNNVDGIRPSSITVNLYGNGTLIESKSVSESDNWSYQFDNLPKNESGVAIVYTITEDAVPGYETTITGYDITNTHIPETVSVSGTKTWSDGNNVDGIRPDSIVVRIYADGIEVANVNPTWIKDGNVWYYRFENLPHYENGQIIQYTVSEDMVENYQTIITGFDITNTYIAPPKEELPKTGLSSDISYYGLIVIGCAFLGIDDYIKRRRLKTQNPKKTLPFR